MSGSGTPVPATLPPSGILARLLTVDGVGSRLDADLVRGRAAPTDVLRFDIAPLFSDPPSPCDAGRSAYLFGG